MHWPQGEASLPSLRQLHCGLEKESWGARKFCLARPGKGSQGDPGEPGRPPRKLIGFKRSHGSQQGPGGASTRRGPVGLRAIRRCRICVSGLAIHADEFGRAHQAENRFDFALVSDSWVMDICVKRLS